MLTIDNLTMQDLVFVLVVVLILGLYFWYQQKVA